jgi:transposase, IS30 family
LAARPMKVVATIRRFGLSEHEQERVWELWGEGTSLRAVARKLCARPEYVRRYVTSTGGVKPAPRMRSKGCLSKDEREEISRGLARGESCRAIAAAIGRTHTAVSREVDRNGGRERYRAHDADEAAWGRARRPKSSKLAVNSRLREVVEERLELEWSPEQISGWLARTYAGELAMQVSHETIYLSLFVQSRGALRRQLCAHLRRRRRTRQPRGGRRRRGAARSARW